MLRARFSAVSSAWLLVFATVACTGNPMPAASAADLLSARQRAPERFADTLTLSDLETGRGLYAERCSSCHQLQTPNAHTAERWAEYVAQMSQRAALSGAEERAVLLYLQVLAKP